VIDNFSAMTWDSLPSWYRKAARNALVTSKELIHGALKRVQIQGSYKAQGGRYIVGRATGFELVEEPEPFLNIRDRQGSLPRSPRDGAGRSRTIFQCGVG
jgi:hypothetical protein